MNAVGQGRPDSVENLEAETVLVEVQQWLDQNWPGRSDRPEVGDGPVGLEPRALSGEELLAWRQRLVDSGWAAPSWPVERFGRGLDPALSRVVEREFRRVGAPGAGQDMVNLWAATVMTFGRDELKDEFIRPLLLGQVALCLLYSEPGAGSDLAAVQTRAVADGDEWIVTGQKVWTSGGRQADYALLIARTDWNVPKHQGITFFFFPMDQPGVEVRPLRQATGDARFNEVFLTEARVPDANRLGLVNHGWRVLQTALAYERLAMGQAQMRRPAGSEGGAVRSPDDERPAPVPDLSLLDLARDAARADDPVARQKLMALRAMGQVNDWNGARAKAEVENGTSSPIASLGKLAMSGILHTAGSLQTELLGAEAMVGGHDSPRSADAAYSLLNAFFTSIGGGTDQIQRNIIGERLLGLPKEPSLDRDVPFRHVPKAGATGREASL